jgi:Fe-S cluster assembly protein SufD
VNALALPTRRDEAWRYSDLEALGEVWPAGIQSETIAIPAGETRTLTLVADAAQPVSVRDWTVTIADGARLDIHILNVGGRYGRIALDITLGEGSHFELGAAQVAGGKTTLEIVTHVRHAAPNSTSRQTVRTVLARQATGTYLGKVAVDRGAQKTDAAQSVKAMLLDRTATANAKPELEIYADDVKCAHGATVGELDATQHFYLTSRGLPPSEARRLLLQAFLADAFAGMDDAEARETLEAAALGALEQLA